MWRRTSIGRPNTYAIIVVVISSKYECNQARVMRGGGIEVLGLIRGKKGLRGYLKGSSPKVEVDD